MNIPESSQNAVIVGLFSLAGVVVQGYVAYKMRNLAHSMNSMREQLVTRTAESSEAAGQEKGIAKEKAEQALRDAGAAKTKVEP